MPRFTLLAYGFPSILIGLSWSFPALSKASASEIVMESQPSDSIVARSLGPTKMGGRVTAVAVVENWPATMLIGTAGGGVWKTTNRGKTWSGVFDQVPVASIGDVAISPSDPNVIWVGTGEANP